jgi:hypothetical protein
VSRISRSEGYRRGRGKESVALDIIAGFFTGLDIPVVPITDANENYQWGDFRVPNGLTLECKGQPIDPTRYDRNFVEVFEITSNSLHAEGFADLALMLGLTLDDLAAVPVRHRGETRRLGTPPCVSVSVRSIFQSFGTVYVNCADGGRWIYLYSRQSLTRHIRREVRRGLSRGVGNSNDDTLAVFVPLPRAMWRRVDGDWIWAGSGDEREVVGALRRHLR